MPSTGSPCLRLADGGADSGRSSGRQEPARGGDLHPKAVVSPRLGGGTGNGRGSCDQGAVPALQTDGPWEERVGRREIEEIPTATADGGKVAPEGDGVGVGVM